MIKLDKDKPIPYFCELKKGCSDTELEEALKRLEIDPTQDDDLRLWFCIQYALPSVSLQFSVKGIKRNLFSYEKLLKITKNRTILKKYWIPREKWDLISISGGSKKLDNTVGGFGFELIKKHWKQASKQVAFHSCSGVKPYHDSHIISSYGSMQDNYDFDAIVASYCPVPIDCDEQYPFAFYQGTHWPASQEWHPLYIPEFLQYYNYENAFLWLRPEGNKPSKVYDILKNSHNNSQLFFLYKNLKEINPKMSNAYYYSITFSLFKEALAPFKKNQTFELF